MLPGPMHHFKRYNQAADEPAREEADSRRGGKPMQGLMMDVPLMISSLIRHADRYHGDTEIVSRTVEGPIHRYTYSGAHTRSRRLARALLRLSVRTSERIGTMACNGHRHFKLY